MSRQDVENGEKVWLEAFNSGDAAGVVATYAKDARMMAPNCENVHGHVALQAFYEDFIAAGGTLAFQLLDVYEGPDFCTSAGQWELTSPDSGERLDHGNYVEVWARQADGSWLIANDTFNSSTPLPVG